MNTNCHQAVVTSQIAFLFAPSQLSTITHIHIYTHTWIKRRTKIQLHVTKIAMHIYFELT